MSDRLHAELTVVVGQLTKEEGRIRTYENAVKSLLERAKLIPPELLWEIESFTEGTSKEEFVEDAIKLKIAQLRGEDKQQRKEPCNSRRKCSEDAD